LRQYRTTPTVEARPLFGRALQSAASSVTAKFISRSGGGVDLRAQEPCPFDYTADYLIDTDHGVIVDVGATRAIRQAEIPAC